MKPITKKGDGKGKGKYGKQKGVGTGGKSKGKSNIGSKVAPNFVCIDIIETITPSVDIDQLIVKVLSMKV